MFCIANMIQIDRCPFKTHATHTLVGMSETVKQLNLYVCFSDY